MYLWCKLAVLVSYTEGIAEGVSVGHVFVRVFVRVFVVVFAWVGLCITGFNLGRMLLLRMNLVTLVQ